MKTSKKILFLSAVSLALAAIPNVKADGVLLSPRAAGNQAGVAIPPEANATTSTAAPRIEANPGALLSPRDRGNQIVKVSGTNSDPDLVRLGLTPDQYVILVQWGQAPIVSGQNNLRAHPSPPPYQVAPVK